MHSWTVVLFILGWRYVLPWTPNHGEIWPSELYSRSHSRLGWSTLKKMICSNCRNVPSHTSSETPGYCFSHLTVLCIIAWSAVPFPYPTLTTVNLLFLLIPVMFSQDMVFSSLLNQSSNRLYHRVLKWVPKLPILWWTIQLKSFLTYSHREMNWGHVRSKKEGWSWIRCCLCDQVVWGAGPHCSSLTAEFDGYWV